jgi:hypothetical protein
VAESCAKEVGRRSLRMRKIVKREKWSIEGLKVVCMMKLKPEGSVGNWSLARWG